MTNAIIEPQPLHLSHMSAVELLHFIEIVRAYRDQDRPAPLDECGYVSDDVIAQWVKAKASS